MAAGSAVDAGAVRRAATRFTFELDVAQLATYRPWTCDLFLNWKPAPAAMASAKRWATTAALPACRRRRPTQRVADARNQRRAINWWFESPIRRARRHGSAPHARGPDVRGNYQRQTGALGGSLGIRG